MGLQFSYYIKKISLPNGVSGYHVDVFCDGTLVCSIQHRSLYLALDILVDKVFNAYRDATENG